MFTSLKLNSLFLMLSLALNAAAMEAQLRNAPADCSAIAEGWYQHLDYIVSHYQENLGVRGLADNHMIPTSERRDAGFAHSGTQWWYTQGYFVKSKEEALKHAAQFDIGYLERFSVGLYFIADESELGVAPTDKGSLVPRKNLSAILAKGAYEIDYFDPSGAVLETPRVRFIPGEELQKRLTIEHQESNWGVTFNAKNARSFDSNYINLFAWHTGKFRGVIDHEQALKSPKLAEWTKDYQRFYGQGFRIIYKPTDPNVEDDAFNVLLNTQRVKRKRDADGNTIEVALPLSINRHRSVGVEHIKNASAYLAVMTNPQGQVVGGSAGKLANMEGETTLYDQIRAGAAGMQLTEAADLACAYVMKIAMAAGVRYGSSGPMVSNFSAGLGAKVKPLPEALALFAQNKVLTGNPPPSNTVWNPFVGDPKIEQGLRAQFKELDKMKQGGSLAYTRFLGARPSVNETTIALAAEKNIVPGKLYIKFIKDLKDATEFAKAHPDKISDVVFMLYPKFDPAMAQSESAIGLLERLSKMGFPTSEAMRNHVIPEDGVAMVYAFKSPTKLEQRRYDEQTLAKRFNLKDKPAATWVTDADGKPVIALEGWVAPQ